MGLLERLSFSKHGRELMLLMLSSCKHTGTSELSRGRQGQQEGAIAWRYQSQPVVAEVQVDQGVELGEASQVLQLVPSQVQGLDVAQVGVRRFQHPQVVEGQIHVDQTVQVLQSHKGYFAGGGQGASVQRAGQGQHGSRCRVRYKLQEGRAGSLPTKTKSKANEM